MLSNNQSPEAQYLVLHKTKHGMMCSPASQDAEIGGSEFTSIISYIANSRSAWEIRPYLKRNGRKEEESKGGREGRRKGRRKRREEKSRGETGERGKGRGEEWRGGEFMLCLYSGPFGTL